jgi:hypothetical protein
MLSRRERAQAGCQLGVSVWEALAAAQASGGAGQMK